MLQRSTALLFGVAALLVSSPLFAQNSGNLTGIVLDQTGAAIAGANVSLIRPGGVSPVATTTTNGQGVFNMAAVQPGVYTLSIESAGFSKQSITNLSVEPGKDTTVPPVNLQIASSAQSVEVLESTQAVQTSSFEVASTITSQQVQNLPVLDRQVSNLFSTQAGVSANGTGSTVINGLRSQYTNITLDGINVQDNFIRLGGLDFIPNKLTIAQVSEFTISSANAPSNYGTGATQITLTTPSGGNQFHGTGYYYNRNSAVAATDWFSNENGTGKQFLNLNQIGGTFGGPVIKDKLFFYVSYEAFRLRETAQQLNTVLTSAARNGVFTYQPTDDSGNPTGSPVQSNVLQLKGLSTDPYITNLLKSTPLPNSNRVGDGLNTAGYAFNARDNETRDNAQGRIDYIRSPKNAFFFTYAWNRDVIDRPDIETFYTPVAPVSNDDYSKLLSVGWRSTLSARLTNELRGGFNFAPGAFLTTGGLPSFYVNGAIFDTPGQNQFGPQGRDTDTYSLQDNASYYIGKHNLSFGYQQQMIRVGSFDTNGDVSPLYTLGFAPSNNNGLSTSDLPGISTDDLANANGLLSSLGGIIQSYNQTFNVTSRTSGFVPGASNKRHFEFDTFSGYVSDKWQVSRKFSAILGLRYDYYTRLNERDSLLLAPRLINNNYIQTVLSNATLDFAGNSVNRPYYQPNNKNFAPNVGFAWDVFGNGKTAVRGGYSITYTNDDTIVAVQNYLVTNGGLQGVVSNPDVIGQLTGGLPPIQTPTLQVPRTFADNLAINPAGNAEGIIDPHLKTPYVQQYSLGVQQEWKGFIFDARFVGNHGIHELRGIDYNQVNVAGTAFLNDFRIARNNLFLSKNAGLGNDPTYNPSVPGSQPLTFLTNLPDGGAFLESPTIRNLISSGQPGSLATTYQTVFTPGLDGGYSFFPSPYGLGMNALTNAGYSNYNSAQFDVRRRLANGQQVQFNYTFSKALSDSNGDLNNNRFEPYLDVHNGRLDKSRAPFDLTHAIKANYVFPLPFGSGHRLSGNGLVNRVIGGWTFSGFITYQSGSPFSIVSRRGTLNRGGSRATYNTVDSSLNAGQLDNLFGVFKTGDGVFFINPSAISPDTGRGVAPDGADPFSGQVFSNPQPGTVGSLQRRQFTGPWFFDWDAQLLKRISVTERVSLDIQAAFFNMTNHPNFTVGQDGSADTNYTVNANNFGKILTTVGTPRIVQFGAYVRF